MDIAAEVPDYEMYLREKFHLVGHTNMNPADLQVLRSKIISEILDVGGSIGQALKLVDEIELDV